MNFSSHPHVLSQILSNLIFNSGKVFTQSTLPFLYSKDQVYFLNKMFQTFKGNIIICIGYTA